MRNGDSLPGRKGGKLYKKLMKKRREKEEKEKNEGTRKVKLRGTRDYVRLPK